MNTRPFFSISVGAFLSAVVLAAADPATPTLRDGEQLPRRMHTAMEELPRVRVGPADADIVGSDHRALQAAVDYIASLGGGVVEVGAGEYLMRDSLHLRPRVQVRGVAGRTVLKKAAAASSRLKLDGDYGEEQVTLERAEGFAVGDGIAIWDRNSGGFHTTVARIIGRRGNTLAISKPLNADCMVEGGATAATVFPVVSGYDLEGAVVEGLVIDGNKGENPMLNGCRGAGIFLYRAFGTVIRDCVVRGYAGDGIGFQQSNDVVVERCTVEQNAGLGFHPGSGSQRPTLRDCVARGNGEDGLFLCWRVKYGVFENNLVEGNGRFGISIGHKDTDNLFRNNRVRANAQDGFFFRNESDGMAGHRNELVGNVVEDNGLTNNAAAIRVRGATRDLVLRDNVLRETRPEGERRQTVGVLVEDRAGDVAVEGNRVENATPLVDRRP